MSSEGYRDSFIKSKELMKVTTINIRLRALRAFYNFLFKNKVIEVNPMKNIKLLRDRQKTIETLDDREIEKLIAVMRKQKSFVSFRDEVILLVFLDTGIRLSELVGIEVEDIRGNTVIIRKTKTHLKELSIYQKLHRNRLRDTLKSEVKLKQKVYS